MFVAGNIIFLTNIVLGLVEALIGLRVVLKLFGASPAAPFVGWIYETTRPLLFPFQGAFPSPSFDGGFLLEFSALFAMIVYALAGYFIVEVLDYLQHRQALRGRERVGAAERRAQAEHPARGTRAGEEAR